MKAIVTCLLILAPPLFVQAQEEPGVPEIAAHPAPGDMDLASPSVVADAAPPEAAVPPALPPDATKALRLVMELTDGSRIVGSPVDESFTMQTGLGALNLKWQLVKSAEISGEGSGGSLVLLNDDRANGTFGKNAIALHTLLGDLNVPLALTRRIRVAALPSGAGPAAYWSFNNPANLGADDSGHGHPVTVKGAQSTDGRIGKGAATGGPGVGNHFIADSDPDLQFSGDFTLSVWAWRGQPLYDGDQLVAKEGEFSLRRYQLPTERYDVELHGKQGVQLAKVSETQSGLPLESWTLIVVCRNDDTLTIRVNDLPAVEVKVAEGEVGNDKPLYIGSSAVGYPWQGKLDEVSKWNRALTEDEQRELFRNPPATPDQPAR